MKFFRRRRDNFNYDLERTCVTSLIGQTVHLYRMGLFYITFYTM